MNQIKLLCLTSPDVTSGTWVSVGSSETLNSCNLFGVPRRFVIPHSELRQFKHVATKPRRWLWFLCVPRIQYPRDAQNQLLWDAKVSLKGSYSKLITPKKHKPPWCQDLSPSTDRLGEKLIHLSRAQTSSDSRSWAMLNSPGMIPGKNTQQNRPHHHFFWLPNVHIREFIILIEILFDFNTWPLKTPWKPRDTLLMPPPKKENIFYYQHNTNNCLLRKRTDDGHNWVSVVHLSPGVCSGVALFNHSVQKKGFQTLKLIFYTHGLFST